MALFSFDFDDCILNFVDHYLQAVNLHAGTQLTVSELTEFDTTLCADRFGKRPSLDSIRRGMEALIAQDCYLNLSVRKDARSVLENLKKDGHQIMGVTQRNMSFISEKMRKKAVNDTHKWVSNTLGDVIDILEITGMGLTKEAVCRKHKALCHCDDSLHYISEFISQDSDTYLALFTQNWNKNPENLTVVPWNVDSDKPAVFRVNDFHDFYQFACRIA